MLAQNSKQVNHLTRQDLVCFVFFLNIHFPFVLPNLKNFPKKKNTLVKCLSNSEDELDCNF